MWVPNICVNTLHPLWFGTSGDVQDIITRKKHTCTFQVPYKYYSFPFHPQPGTVRLASPDSPGDSRLCRRYLEETSENTSDGEIIKQDQLPSGNLT